MKKETTKMNTQKNNKQEIKMNEYVTLKYWFEIDSELKSDGTPDNRYTGQKEGWREVTVTQEEALNIIEKGTLRRVRV